MSKPRIIYLARPEATPESEPAALASVYRFILDSAKKKAARPGRPDDEKEILNGCAATPEYNR